MVLWVWYIVSIIHLDFLRFGASLILETFPKEFPSVFLIQPEIGPKAALKREVPLEEIIGIAPNYIRQISYTCTYIVFTIYILRASWILYVLISTCTYRIQASLALQGFEPSWWVPSVLPIFHLLCIAERRSESNCRVNFNFWITCPHWA